MNKIKRQLFLTISLLTVMTTTLGCSNSTKKSKDTEKILSEIQKILDEDDDLKNNKEIENEEKYEENNSKEQQTILISNNSQLDDYINNDITFSDVINAVNNNDNLSEEYKSKLIKIVDKIEQKIPYIDLRCLYENIRLLQIEKISKEEMKERQNINVVAYFSPAEHKIVFCNESDQVFNHEALHMLNSLDVVVDGIRLIRSYESKNKLGKAQEEGFIQWLNLYLFGYKENESYKEQVADSEIIKCILNENNQELITDFLNYNYKKVYNKIKKYIPDDISNLYKILEKERQVTENIDTDDLLYESEIEEKYNLLTAAFVVSRNGNLNGNELLRFQNLLANSHSYYFNGLYKDDLNIDYNISEYIRTKTMKTLLNYGKNTNNSFTIIMDDNKKLDYYNFNNLYFGYTEEEDTSLIKKIIIEAYTNSDNETCYYIPYNYINSNDLTKYNLMLVSDILGANFDSGITLNEISSLYKQINSEDKQYTYSK